MADIIVAHAICTLPEAKAWLKFESPSAAHADDDEIQRAINVTTSNLETYLDQRIKARAADIEEVFSGDGLNTYWVKHAPIQSITEIEIEDVVTLDDTDCADTDKVRYDPESGQLWVINYVFSRYYPRNCKVTYKGGWNAPDAATFPMPWDIWQGAREITAGIYRLSDKQKEDIKSISTPTGETVTFFIGMMRPETKMKVDMYRSWRVGE